jgi:hydroxymethylbilane synthase
MSDIFRIGTRNSPLALKQADQLQSALKNAHPDLMVEIVPIRSNADWKKGEGEKPLAEEAGGKGLFAKEIEERILAGEIDAGVHSTKDMASFLPEGLALEHVLPRANPCDALICQKAKTIEDLPQGAVIGTCSPRRQALALSKRPDLKIVPFRGNVGTRIQKIKDGQVDATFLAMAGIERLGIEDDLIHPLAAEAFLPACGQGAICMEIREGDNCAKTIFDAVNCIDTLRCVTAERAVLKVLDGSCHTPLAAYAVMKGEALCLKAVVASVDGREIYQEQNEQSCPDVESAANIGREVGERLKAAAPAGILAA